MTVRTRKRFTEEEKAKICELWQQGYTATKICHEIKSLNGRKPQTLYPVLIKAGLYKKKPANDLRRYKVDDHYFDKIDTEHKAYWLGFMLADGFLTDAGHATKTFGMTLKSDDRYILEAFREDLSASYPIHDYISRFDWGQGEVETLCSRLLIKSPRIFEQLAKMGFSTDKSHDAIFPWEFVPEKLIRHVIRGYFDGDGGLSVAGEKKWHTYSLTFTGTIEVISAIRTIIGKENVKLTKRYPERNNNNCSLNLCGDLQVYKICKWMYEDATIYLKRKHERFKILENKYVNKKQSSPQECGGL